MTFHKSDSPHDGDDLVHICGLYIRFHCTWVVYSNCDTAVNVVLRAVTDEGIRGLQKFIQGSNLNVSFNLNQHPFTRILSQFICPLPTLEAVPKHPKLSQVIVDKISASCMKRINDAKCQDLASIDLSIIPP